MNDQPLCTLCSNHHECHCIRFCPTVSPGVSRPILNDAVSRLQVDLCTIAQHASQITDITEVKKEIAGWNRYLGESKGFPYAEAFKTLQPHCEVCR